MKHILIALIIMLFAMPTNAADEPRVVTIGGAVTEIIYALGKESMLVGNDTTSYYPPAAATLPKVGYQRTLSAEGILSLKPTLIFTTDQAGPAVVLKQLQEAGVEIITLPEKYSVESTSEHIRTIANRLDAKEKGEALIAEMDTALRGLQEMLAKDAALQKPRVLFLLQVGQSGAPLVAGRNTAADSIIKLAGGENVVDAYEGYKPYNREAAVAAEPDILLTTDHTLDGVGGKEKLLELPGIALTPAGKAKRLISMDALLLLGFGPRTAQAGQELSESFLSALKKE